MHRAAHAPHSAHPRLLLAVLVAAALWPDAAHGQAVNGVVVDATSSAPVPEVTVRAIDDGGREHGGSWIVPDTWMPSS
jgi:hypothetical protein